MACEAGRSFPIKRPCISRNTSQLSRSRSNDPSLSFPPLNDKAWVRILHKKTAISRPILSQLFEYPVCPCHEDRAVQSMLSLPCLSSHAGVEIRAG